MEITNEIVERFFEGQCTAAEAEAVAQYLKEHAEAQDTHLNKKEWDDLTINTAYFPAHLTSEMWKEIKKGTTRRLAINLKRAAVAACFLGVILLSYLVISNSSNRKKSDQQREIATVKQENSAKSVSVVNLEAKEKAVQLPDGSQVTLLAFSRMTYEIDATLRVRTISLEGDALFKVAKDSTKPFTVYSGYVSTTALGTEFYVSNQKEPGQVTVSLYEGKVMVKTNLKTSTGVKTYYLMPGNKLIYDTKSLVTRIIGFKKDHDHVVKGGKNISNWFMFNNDNLSATLDQLSAIYGVQILYEKEDLKGMSFIGEIRKSDSIKNILRDIAYLNNLTVTREDRLYIIQKKK